MNKGETFIILTPGFPKDEADTVCLPMQQSFIRCLKEMFPHLNIIILSFQYPYHKNSYKWFDIPVIPFGGRNKGGISRLLLRKKINATLKEINNTTKITGLLSFWYNECALVGKEFSEKTGIKHYCWILGQDARKENKYPERIRPNAHELIALSDFLQNEFKKNHGIRPQQVIPPGIDSKQFDIPSKKREIDSPAAGSLIPLKQYPLRLKIVADIKRLIPGIKAM